MWDITLHPTKTAQLSINSGLAAPSHETPRRLIAYATSSVSCDGAAKPELTDSCSARSPALFLSHARDCRTYRHPLSIGGSPTPAIITECQRFSCVHISRELTSLANPYHSATVGKQALTYTLHYTVHYAG